MPYLFNTYYPVRKVLFFLGEGGLIFLSVLGILLLFSSWHLFLVVPGEFALRAAAVTLVFQLTLYFYDLYDLRKPGTTTETFVRMMQAFGVGCIILAFLYSLFPSIIISTTVFWGCYLTICVSLLAWRSLYYLILEKKWFAREVLVVGTGEMAKQIVQAIAGDKESGFTIGALVGGQAPQFDHPDIPIIPDLARLVLDPRLSRVDRIVVALDDRRGTMPIADLLSYKLRGDHRGWHFVL